MKKIKFYMCPTCGNVTTSTGEVDVSCCGQRLHSLTEQSSDEKHSLNVEVVENDFYITFSHEMTKEHYISFIASVSWDRITLVRLYPEQSGELRIPMFSRSKFYLGCNKHGLWKN